MQSLPHNFHEQHTIAKKGCLLGDNKLLGHFLPSDLVSRPWKKLKRIIYKMICFHASNFEFFWVQCLKLKIDDTQK